ncbi:MAG: hypothetical protein OQK48_08615 [Sulfurimonas sp.]|uniref:hypothetical protein n=1 Tax=Sulfurimonas sp. TaxID=2022749 RepID=UPI0026066EB0|nr:hypothetical protein [Sulfurimonas sp.]MCW8896054.1 hypothetical protein [Sulfurimonas sp.]MCW8954986.1 hypothetical protein [Sulfurimonas sp.]
MQNPFESGHIKNYLLLYASVVVIMVLFFIASTLFLDVEDIEKKTFATESSKISTVDKENNIVEEKSQTNSFRLLEVNSTSYGGYNGN